MDQQQRRALEAAAYGRGSTDEQRAEAVRAIRDAERAVVLRVHPSAPADDDPELGPAMTVARRLWRAPARTVVLWVMGGIAAAAVAVVAVTVVLAPHPRDAASEPRNHDRPPLTQLVSVGDDWLANPPTELDRLRIEAAAQPAAVTAATELGERDGNVAVGVLTDDGRVCIVLMLAPETSAASGTSSQGFCATSAEFAHDGVVADRGAWDVHWFSDGTVTWTGI